MPHPLAGKPAPASILVDVPRLVSAYYTRRPDADDPAERVSFGTSGHRGSSLRGSFNEAHIVATSAAIVEHRAAAGVSGPLFLGMDTHALSTPALHTALEVFAAAGVEVRIDAAAGYTPTPSVSFAILEHNRRSDGARLADGVVVTPSHNPPDDGGFKYNPPHGGPAGSETTRVIEQRANELLRAGVEHIPRFSVARALRAESTVRHDYITPYVEALDQIVDVVAIANAGVRIGVDPMGGAGVAYWGPIAERYGLDITVVNSRVDPSFAFMAVDKDGKIRMDCSSPYAMANLLALKDDYDIAFGNDTDYDRHGIVTPSVGLMNPNHYLAVAIDYLFRNRPAWRSAGTLPTKRVGKTLVSSAMIDRVAASLGAPLYEVPVGFKWFVDGLLSGALGFGGEESAGASFARKDGSVWTTDKDGIVMDLLAAEITARTGEDPGRGYRALEARHGAPVYERLDAPLEREQRATLARLSPEQVTATELAGEPIRHKLTRAPGNDAEIGGLKVVTDNGWFAARPSGTEDVYKIYAESFKGREHLVAIQEEAKAIVQQALAVG